MLGYVVAGPVIALLVSLKFTQLNDVKQKKKYEELQAKVVLLEVRNEAVDKEMLHKIMTTVMPIAKAVNKLNQEVGL